MYEGVIQDLIDELDKPQPQVLIQVLLAEVTLDSLTDLGVEWAYQGKDGDVTYGIGTDFNLGPYNPFISLHYLVTGKMVGGLVVNRQPISREDALIAHTRRNAFFVFQENNLGAIQPGKLADLVVLDRDYLTVPADQIKDIKPVLTMVGGTIVYDAAAETATR